MAIEEDSRTPIVCYIFARALVLQILKLGIPLAKIQKTKRMENQ